MGKKEKNETRSKRGTSKSDRTAAPDDAPALTDDESPLLQPNVKLAGEAEPLGAGPVTVGMATIGELPNEEQQRAGFYFPAPQQLIRLFPESFKLIVEKGK